MNTAAISIICGTLVALAAISAATTAAILGTIDGASFSAIRGTAIGGVGGAAGGALIQQANGRHRAATPVVKP